MIKLETGTSLAVIFVDDVSVNLNDVRKQIREEVDELVPKNFHFISTWGSPVSHFQEGNMSLSDALHSDDALLLRVFKEGNVSLKRTAPKEPDEHNPTKEIPEESSASGSSGVKESPCKNPAAKRSRTVQSTLTRIFGAKSSPTTRYASAAVRKGVHLYSEKDIETSSRSEKERRKWWNEKAKELCENSRYESLRGEAIDQKLHEEWKINKATKMLHEEKETRKAIEEIIERYPDLDQYLEWKNKMKSETLVRNVTRVEVAAQQLKRSRDKVEKLSARLQNTEETTAEFCKLKKEMEEHQGAHKFHIRELTKAQDAMSKVLSTKKTQLRKLMEKSRVVSKSK